MENQNLSGAEQKVLEYIERINNGESKEQILQGLPHSFVEAIEDGLERQEDFTAPQKEDIVEEYKVPPQYEGLDSEMLDYIWTIPEYTDPEKTKSEKERKAMVLEHLKAEESSRLLKDEQEKKDAESISQIEKALDVGDAETGLLNLKNSIEKYSISLPNLDSIIENGGGQLEVLSGDNKIDFENFAITVDNNIAEVMFVRKKDRTNNPGVGLATYVELGKKLKEKGIILTASGAQYGPGSSVWQKLYKLNLAERYGGRWRFIDDKDKGGQESEKLKIGDPVIYGGKNFKIIEVLPFKYSSGKVIDLYHLEREDGYQLSEGNVKKYVTRESFNA